MKKLIIIVLSILFIGCNNEVPSQPTQPAPQAASQPQQEQPQEEHKSVTWSALDTGLPTGVIVAGEITDGHYWLSIKDPITNEMRLAKDVDPQVWKAVNVGDVIK